MHKNRITIGIDEVGRGALAGPVFVGAVALGDVECASIVGLFPKGVLRDSKKSSAQLRARISDFVQEHCVCAVGLARVEHIDVHGISWALRKAATEALEKVVEKLPADCEVVVSADAGLFHNAESKYETSRTIRGDEIIIEILLASHLAKVTRDAYMAALPEASLYGWATNAGYGTAFHGDAIEKNGLSKWHRKTFCTRFH